MHVLFVADLDTKGGAPRSLYQLISHIRILDPAIHISIVLPTQSPLSDKYRKLGCSVYTAYYEDYLQGIPQQKWKLVVKYPLYLIKYLLGRAFASQALETDIDWDSIDLIHSNSSREDLGAILAAKHHKPLVWHIREFGNLDYPIYSYRKHYIQFMNENAIRLVAISDAVRNHWIHMGISPKKIIRIYNGVDSTPTKKRGYRASTEIPLKLCMIGNFHETKGQLQAVEAISRLPKEILKKTQLDFIGKDNGVYGDKVRKRIAQFHLDDTVHVIGYRADIYQNLCQYDCGLMCSRSEGFGRVTVEYMMAGLPVIASDAGANPELIHDGVTGLLYHWNDCDDLAEKIIHMVEQPDINEKMGRIAAAYACDHFSSQENAKNILNLYREILI